MMTRMITAAAIGTLLLSAAPALAQSVESDAIELKNIEKGKQSIKADRAYILVTGSNRSQGMFYKTATEEDRALFQEDWEEEYADALKKYQRRLEKYEEEQKDKRAGSLPPNYRLMEKPVEVTRENFSIGSIEQRLTAHWGPMFVFDKDKSEGGEKSFSYLLEVDPGEYTYYGALFVAPNGSTVGTCMCMGSVKFTADAGVITNLGDFAMMQWFDDEAGREVNVLWDETSAKREPARPIDYSVPASLAKYDVVRAELHAAGKVDNWYGIMIGRLPPMEGVLAYERDRIVDVREAERLANANDAAEVVAAIKAELTAEAEAAEGEAATDAADAGEDVAVADAATDSAE